MADPRHRRGVRRRLAVILGLALCSVVAGARSFTAIAEWALDADEQTLSMLGLTGAVPSESTFRRTCSAWTPVPSVTWPVPGRSGPRCRGQDSGGSLRSMARRYAARPAALNLAITCWLRSIMLMVPS